MQLVAYGAQDVYLTGSPQITFFKVVYRRHTNFAVEPIPQTFNGASDFGRTVTCTINRNGDLITNMYVNISLNPGLAGTAPWGFVRRLGHAIVQHYKIEIGGSKIDEQYGDWLNIWYELTHKTGQVRGYANMIGDVDALTALTQNDTPAYQLYVPLQFWFNRNNGLALPLIALQYHDVRITIDYRPAAQCVNVVGTGNGPSISMGDSQLIIDYVYLDAEERKRFAQASHEYLFEQLQFTGSESLTGLNPKFRLNFNHPSKYLIWTPKLNKYTNASSYVAYAPNGDWATARDNFAKLVWLASRQVRTTCTTVNTANITLLTEPDTPLTIIDNVIAPAAAWVNTTNLNAKVTAYILAPQDASGQTYTNVTVNINQIVLLTNNFTSDDLSYDATTILSNYATSGQTVSANCQSLLSVSAVSVYDHFNYANYLDGNDNPAVAAKLQLNGSDRFQQRDGAYFNYVQPLQGFSNTPSDGINVYSFALKPEDHQPSGTCNFSRIDNATLQLQFGSGNAAGDSNYLANYLGGSNSASVVNIYTVNYNVLRVMSGMAGAAYSN